MMIYRKIDPLEVDRTLQALVELTLAVTAWHLGISVPLVVWMRATADTRGLAPFDAIGSREAIWGMCRWGRELWLDADMPHAMGSYVTLHEMRHLQQFIAGAVPFSTALLTPALETEAKADAEGFTSWLTTL